MIDPRRAADAATPDAPSAPLASESPVSWPDPDDQSLTWDLDDMHMPFAQPPLALDYLRVLAAGFNPVYEEWDLPMRVRMFIANGYAFFALDPGSPDLDETAVLAQRTERNRAFIRVSLDYWEHDAMPRILAAERRIRTVDVDGLSPEDLAAAWAQSWLDIGELWTIHFKAIRGAYQVTEDLADLYESIVPDASPGEALALIQGENTTLHEVEAGVERLADLIAEQPAVRRRFASGPSPTIEEIEALDGGAEVAWEVRQFIDAHGHLGQAFDDLTMPSWGEEPHILLAELAQRLTHAPERSADRTARLRVEADRLANAARARLTAEPERLASFEDLLSLGRTVGPLTEVHNYWIDRMAQARIRALSVRVGRRLVREGSIDAADDVFYLERDEVEATIRRPTDRRALVAERREEHMRQRAMRPPIFLGKARENPEADRFGGGPQEHESATQLGGVGASAGIATGPARVTLGPDDFGRIAPGDIIVCPSSNPSWVPVFAIAGGLVTNTGGVLSHAAVVAREFGLPAVVGVSGATTLIPDGRLVEIDGTTGSVRLL